MLSDEWKGETDAGSVYFRVLDGVDTGDEAYDDDAERGNDFCFCGLD